MKKDVALLKHYIISRKCDIYKVGAGTTVAIVALKPHEETSSACCNVLLTWAVSAAGSIDLAGGKNRLRTECSVCCSFCNVTTAL